MPVPFESLVPFAVISGMFVAASLGIRFAQNKRNEGKAIRYSIDDWDRKMMTRDKQLTGSIHSQSATPIAPPEFKTNSVWKVYHSHRNIL